MGEIGNRENSGRHAGNRAGDGRQKWNVTRATKKGTSRGSARPTLLKDVRETDSHRHHNSVGPQEGAATEESVMVGNGLYLSGRIEGNGVSFLVDTGFGVSILAARTWRKWGRAEDELARYSGRLCSVEGRALECLGRARLTVTLGTRVIEWSFIVAEIGDD